MTNRVVSHIYIKDEIVDSSSLLEFSEGVTTLSNSNNSLMGYTTTETVDLGGTREGIKIT